MENDKKETTATEEEVASNQNEPGQEDQQADVSPELDGIPQKFVGKSPAEIIRAYNELHSSFGRVTSEKAEERKQREQLEARIREVESRVTHTPAQQQSQQQVEQEDLLSDYDSQMEENPKEFLKTTLKKLEQKTASAAQAMVIENDKRAASEYYHSQKKSTGDFADLEPVMNQLAQEYGDLVKAEKSASVKTLKLLHLAARGACIEKYEKAAVERAKKEGSTVRQEKQQAFSESTRSAGDQKVNFKDLSLEEMEKFLGFSDK